jgi:hypothetical protein
MITDVATPSNTIARCWRVSLDDRADLVFALRDYFRRLGLPVEVEGPTFVFVKTDEPVDELEAYVRDWSRVNGVPLSFEEEGEEPAMMLAPPAEAGPPRLGELLVRKGFITEEQLTLALNEARETRELLGLVLIRDGMIFEDELARTLSEQLSIPYLSIMRIGFDSYAARLLPAEVGAAAAAIPVRVNGATVHVAFADPTDPQAISAVREHLPKIEIAVAELSDIRLAWREVARLRGLPAGG